MFHIVFEPADVAILSQAMDLDPALDGEIICFEEDYSIGPIRDLDKSEGWDARRQWLKDSMAAEAILAAEQSPDPAALQQLTERMQSETFDEIWIWVSSNARDVSGYYWLISQLGVFAGRVFVISLNNLPFINEKGAVFYPAHLYEILPKECVKARRLARPVTAAEFEVDPDEWTRLVNENKDLRILEGAKKLVQAGDDYFDASLKKMIPAEGQKAHRLIHQFLSKSSATIAESYLQWRLRILVSTGNLTEENGLIRALPAEAI